MAETKEERRARIEKEVAERSAARREAYFEKQAESKAAAAAKTPPLPEPDAFVYNYAWKQDVGAPTGEIKLVKSPNPYYDPATNTVTDPATGETKPATQSMWSGTTVFRGDGTVGTTGTTKATSTVDPYAAKYAGGYGMDAAGNQYRGAGTTADPMTVNGSPFTGTWQGKNYKNGMLVTPVSITGDGSGSGISTGAGSGAGTGTGTMNAGPSLARDTFKNTLALFFGAAEAAKPWADALYGVVSKYFRSGSDANESFNLALQEARTNPDLKPFADRFKGIFALQDMRQQGKPVLVPTIGEYVASQAGMSNLLTEAGLGNLATEEFTGDLIGKGNSVSTVADKIAKAFTRIDLAPRAIKDTLSRFYPTVDRTTLARTILTGEKGVQQLVDELAEYEVLAAAEQQGLGAIQRAGGLTQERAREIARAGGTFESTLGKFGQIARVMPDVTKLAGISRREDIGQAGLERAVISQSQKELSELEKLSLEEEARYRARAGRAELGLASQRRANRAF